MWTTEIVSLSTNVEFFYTSCVFFYIMIICAYGKFFFHSSESEKFKFVSVNKFEEVFSRIFFWLFSLRIHIYLFRFLCFIISITKWRFILLPTHISFFFQQVKFFEVVLMGGKYFYWGPNAVILHFTLIKNGHIT